MSKYIDKTYIGNYAPSNRHVLWIDISFETPILKSYLNGKWRQVSGANAFKLVDTEEYPTLNDFLASDGEQGVIYLYPNGTSSDYNRYNEYIWVNDIVRYELLNEDISGKADKVKDAVEGNFAGIDSNGNLIDSGKTASDFATAEQGTKAETAKNKADNAVSFAESQSLTDAQRNTALANVSNQTANSTTGKIGYKVLEHTNTFAEQVTVENTIYEIRDVFDLGGTQETPVSVTLPAGSTLKFNGGLIKNCTLNCNNTYLDGDIKLGATLNGSIKNTHIEYEWFVDKTPQKVADYALALGKGIRYNKSLTLEAPLSLFGIKDVYIANISNSETNYIELGADATLLTNSRAVIDNANYIIVSGGKSLNYKFQNVNNIIFRAGDNSGSKGSIGYCYFEMGRHNSIKLQGIGNGWINDNVFMGGRYISSIEITGGDYIVNHNIFIAPHIENANNTTISFTKCAYNKFTNCRMEGFPTITQTDSYCNTVYQDYNVIYNQDILQALRSSYFGKGNSRSFCTEDLTIQSFTIDKNFFKNGRDCDKVSLCDKLDSFRLETTDTYIKAIIHPNGNNFGFSFDADGANDTLRHYVYLYDKNGDVINDNYLNYIKTIGGYTTTVGSNGRYYVYSGTVNTIFSQINVESINSVIGEGVQIGWVCIFAFPGNVRKTLRGVNCVFASYKSANITVSVTSKHKTPINISTAIPTIKETISGVTVPHSILDGEYCEYNGILYKRSGNVISVVGQYNGRGTTANRPDVSSVAEGYQYYDTTIKKWIMSNGTSWVNIDGTALS